MLPLVVALALASAPQKWVALVHVSADAPAAWRQPLQEAAEANKQSSAWAPPPAVTLDEAQLALGCTGWNKACAGQIAGMTGAVAALVIDVSAGANGGVVVTVGAVKASGALIGVDEKLELPGKTAKDLEIARDFVKNAPKGARLAYVVIDSDTPGAEVAVDDGKKMKMPFEEALPPGEHTLVATAEGKAPLTKKVSLKPGMFDNVMLQLSAVGPSTDIAPTVGVKVHELTTAAPIEPRTATQQSPVVAWSLVGAGGVIALGGSVVAGAAIYDRYYHRINCGADNKPCVPAVPLMLGLYGGRCGTGATDHKCADERLQFLNTDAGAWIGGGLGALAAGALLLGTGVVMLPDEASTATPATAPASP